MIVMVPHTCNCSLKNAFGDMTPSCIKNSIRPLPNQALIQCAITHVVTHVIPFGKVGNKAHAKALVWIKGLVLGVQFGSHPHSIHHLLCCPYPRIEIEAFKVCIHLVESYKVMGTNIRDNALQTSQMNHIT
jgi:hypothetical protein